jgi:predicted transcriptional regulator
MASGQQLSEQNFVAFNTWLASKTDDDFRQLASRGVLSRKEIAIECGFSKSALDQNPRIKAALKAEEQALRERGVLPAVTEKSPEQATEPLMREVGKLKIGLDAERLRRLEQENASLRSENGELKRQLERYAVIREALSMTGRVPR